MDELRAKMDDLPLDQRLKEMDIEEKEFKAYGTTKLRFGAAKRLTDMTDSGKAKKM
jgi:hypothetical protein